MNFTQINNNRGNVINMRNDVTTTTWTCDKCKQTITAPDKPTSIMWNTYPVATHSSCRDFCPTCYALLKPYLTDSQ